MPTPNTEAMKSSLSDAVAKLKSRVTADEATTLRFLAAMEALPADPEKDPEMAHLVALVMDVLHTALKPELLVTFEDDSCIYDATVFLAMHGILTPQELPERLARVEKHNHGPDGCHPICKFRRLTLAKVEASLRPPTGGVESGDGAVSSGVAVPSEEG